MTFNKRQTVLLDTSVWVSFIGKDANFFQALEIMKSISKSGATLLVPTIVYAEIIVVLYRANYREMNKIKQKIMTSGNVRMVNVDADFYLFKLAKYLENTKLKTSDFLILAHAYEYNVDQFYSLDKNQLKEYLLSRKYYA